MSSDPRVPGASEPGCIHFFGPDAPAGVPPGLEVLGGKGINLVELTRAKFPVPPGFVITTKAYQDFFYFRCRTEC